MPLVDKDKYFTVPPILPKVISCEWCGGVEWTILTNKDVFCANPVCNAMAGIDEIFLSLTH